MIDLPSPTVTVHMKSWGASPRSGDRVLPEEVAVAMTYDLVTFAVMMASPADIEDFGIGFSISEGIIASAAEISNLEIVTLPAGIECRMSLAPAQRAALEARRRRIAGPVGCGLCGMESLAEAIKPATPVMSDVLVPAAAIMDAIVRLPGLQILNQTTRAVHAAAFLNIRSGELLVREDVGRHNALDKLIGAIRADGADVNSGVVLLTSRVSIELIQKTAALGCGILVAVSAPSARAVRDAEAAGITLIAVARDDGFEIFTHPHRIIGAYAPYRSTG